MPLMQSKKVYRAISFLTLAAFIVTNACFASSGSGALRPAMVMGKAMQPSAAGFQPQRNRIAEDYAWLVQGTDGNIRKAILDKVTAHRTKEPLSGEEAFRAAEAIINDIFTNKTTQEPLFAKDMEHAQCVLDCVKRIDGKANVAVRIASLAHDIDRAFDDIRVRMSSAASKTFTYPEKIILHPRMSARLISCYLRAANIDEAIINEVERLILHHEAGVDGYSSELGSLAKIEPSDPFYETLNTLVAGDSMAEFILTLDITFDNKDRESFLAEQTYKYGRIKDPSIRALADRLVEEKWARSRPDVYQLFLQARRAAIINIMRDMIKRDRSEYGETGYMSLLLLKGGEEEGGCQTELRSPLLERLKKHWLLVLCPVRRIGEAGVLAKWGRIGLQYPLNFMETNPKFSKEFIDIARGMIKNGDVSGLKKWISEADALDPADMGHKALSRALDYLSRESQQILLYRISGRSEIMREYIRGENGEELSIEQIEEKAKNLLNGRDPYRIDEQDFFKEIVVGATNPLRAHPGSLRHNVGERYQEGGSLRPAVERSRAEFGIDDIGIIASIMNVFHSPNKDEIPEELNQMAAQDLEILEKELYRLSLARKQETIGVFAPLEAVLGEARFGM